jgi:Ricin-type beta-trefoil lectin domain
MEFALAHNMAKSNALGFVGACLLSACATTYVAPPDPLPVIGVQLLGESGTCIDVQDGGTADGTPLVIHQCHGSPNERWFIAHGVISENYGSCLDLNGGASVERATLLLISCNGANSQRWSISDGQILSETGLCVAVAGSQVSDFTPLVLMTCDHSASQRWTVH